jgi:hypothetical protein
VQDLKLSPPLTGNVAQALAMRVSNPQPRAVRGPLRIMVTCFNEARLPVNTVTRKLGSTRKLGKGQTIALTVPLATLCPTYLVGALAAS